jgi:hypothetical protein
MLSRRSVKLVTRLLGSNQQKELYSSLDIIKYLSLFLFRATPFLFAGYLANKNNYMTHLSV